MSEKRAATQKYPPRITELSSALNERSRRLRSKKKRTKSETPLNLYYITKIRKIKEHVRLIFKKFTSAPCRCGKESISRTFMGWIPHMTFRQPVHVRSRIYALCPPEQHAAVVNTAINSQAEMPMSAHERSEAGTSTSRTVCLHRKRRIYCSRFHVKTG